MNCDEQHSSGMIRHRITEKYVNMSESQVKSSSPEDLTRKADFSSLCVTEKNRMFNCTELCFATENG